MRKDTLMILGSNRQFKGHSRNRGMKHHRISQQCIFNQMAHLIVRHSLQHKPNHKYVFILSQAISGKYSPLILMSRICRNKKNTKGNVSLIIFSTDLGAKWQRTTI